MMMKKSSSSTSSCVPLPSSSSTKGKGRGGNSGGPSSSSSTKGKGRGGNGGRELRNRGGSSKSTKGRTGGFNGNGGSSSTKGGKGSSPVCFSTMRIFLDGLLGFGTWLSHSFCVFFLLQTYFCPSSAPTQFCIPNFYQTYGDYVAADTWRFYNLPDSSVCFDPTLSWDTLTVPDLTYWYSGQINVMTNECYTVTVTNLSPNVLDFSVGDVTFDPTFIVYDIPGGVLGVQPGETAVFEVDFDIIQGFAYMEVQALGSLGIAADFSVIFRDSNGNCVNDIVLDGVT